MRDLDEQIEFNFENLTNFINHKTPMTACYYCYGSAGMPIEPGEQLSAKEIKHIKLEQGK